jgi:hypothetical protein
MAGATDASLAPRRRRASDACRSEGSDVAVPSSGNQRTSEQGSSDSGSRRSRLSITWESTGGAETKGVVTFHGLDDRLSRVEVEMEYDLSGSDLLGNLLRIPRWRFRRDLKLSKQDEEAQVVESQGPRNTRSQRPRSPGNPQPKSAGNLRPSPARNGRSADGRQVARVAQGGKAYDDSTHGRRR